MNKPKTYELDASLISPNATILGQFLEKVQDDIHQEGRSEQLFRDPLRNDEMTIRTHLDHLALMATARRLDIPTLFQSQDSVEALDDALMLERRSSEFQQLFPILFKVVSPDISLTLHNIPQPPTPQMQNDIHFLSAMGIGVETKGISTI